MLFSFYVGIDVSKNSLDLAIRDQQRVLFHTSVENNAAGLNQFEVQCRSNGIDLTGSLLCWGSPAANILVSIAKCC